MSASEENKSTRKSLATIQQTSISRENIVGRRSPVTKHHLSLDSVVEVSVTKKKHLSTRDQETQVDFTNTISVDDLTNPEEASEKYWKILAGKRQVALQEALSENDKLREIIEGLRKELNDHKQMLEEANSFVEVIKEELSNCNNDDTGIDVNDVSNADEAEQE